MENKFSKSAGIVAITAENEVVLIQRMIPYCYENYLYRKRLPLTPETFAEQLDDFVREELPELPPNERTDFLRYLLGCGTMEDHLDFPHGQIAHRKIARALTAENGSDHARVLFDTALKEFREETGFTFEFRGRPTELHAIRFVARDGYEYTQFFFRLTGVELERLDRREAEHYLPVLLDVAVARRLLAFQQYIKRDGKHLLL